MLANGFHGWEVYHYFWPPSGSLREEDLVNRINPTLPPNQRR